MGILAQTGSMIGNNISIAITADGSSIIGQKYLMVGGQANDGDVTVSDISLTATNGSQLSVDIAIDREIAASRWVARAIATAAQWSG